MESIKDFIFDHQWEIIYAVIFAVIVEIVFKYFHHRKERKKNVKTLFNFYGKSTLLKPEDLMGITRPYNKYYFQRDFDKQIEGSIAAKKNVLLIGSPLSGKSRAVYEALACLNKPLVVVIPRCIDIEPAVFYLPPNTELVYIDDLHRLVEQQNFDFLFKLTIERNVALISSCRSGIEFEKVKNLMLEKNIFLDSIFKENNTISITDITDEAGKEIAIKSKVEWDKKNFNKTPGSIFMQLTEMEKRFSECSNEEKTIMRSIKNLYDCGLCEDNRSYPVNWIKISSGKFGLTGKDFEWNSWMEKLQSRELIIFQGDKIIAEETYLEKIVKHVIAKSLLEVYDDMISSFSQEPSVLFKIGLRTFETGCIDIQKAKYLKASSKAYENALKIYKSEKFPLEYSLIMNNLGNTLRRLGEVEDKEINCMKAIESYEESLKFRTIEKYHDEYASVQNNLGNTYVILGELGNKAVNSKKAIKAFQEALLIYTPGHDRDMYAKALNNIANAYITLAEAEDKAVNCTKAIEACENALKIHTQDDFPKEYAMVQNTLGIARTILAQAEEKPGNCKKAITAFKESLKIRISEKFPIDYASVQYNLGCAYELLAEAEDSSENYKIAAKYFDEALTIFTVEHFPSIHETIQKNLESVKNTMISGIKELPDLQD